MQNKISWVVSKLALIGGLIHIAAVLSILFLPLFTTCQYTEIEQAEKCYVESYIQIGGNALGYSFLLLMILAGMAAIYSSFIFDSQRANIIRLPAIIASGIVIVIAGFSFGAAFIPGALLTLLAALLQPCASRQPVENKK